MKLRKELIAKYLRVLTQGRAGMLPNPMSDPANFDADIRTMSARAKRAGDLDWLRLSINSLLANPEGRIGQFAGLQYPYSDEDLGIILARAYEQIWPDRPRSEPGDELDIEFVDMSAEDWALFSGEAT